MSTKFQGLTTGLLAGYGGKSEFGSATRGSFPMQTSHFENEDITYHDEWFPGSNGGGQELVKTGNEMYTRLYAGGVISEKELIKLGITEKEVISELMRRIQELGAATRLFANCNPNPNGHWGYSYTILNTNPNVEMTMAKEIIIYDHTIVFIHGFLLSPLK